MITTLKPFLITIVIYMSQCCNTEVLHFKCVDPLCVI